MKRCLLALLVFAVAGCAATTPVAPISVAPKTARFKILQINDVYKIEGLEGGTIGGMARVRSLRKQLESDGSKVYVMHGGDLLFPSVMSKYLQGEPMIDVMNLLDGDPAAADAAMYVGFGNHELDPSDDRVLLTRLRQSQFWWVATNTEHCKEAGVCGPFREAAATVAETVLLDVDDGLQVGVIGLLYPITKKYARSTDVIAAAQHAFDALSQMGADVTIAITHQEMPDDVKLAEALPGLDVIIGGHDHLFMQQRIGSTWITKADADAKSAIVYDITVDAEGRVRTAPLRIALDPTMPKDPEVDAVVQKWLQTLMAKIGNETIGTTENLLEGVEPAVRGRETALGNLLTDAARAHMGTDVALLNGGSIRINDNIPPGPITTYDMEGVFYYKNDLVAFPLTGQQLLEMLRNGVSRADAGDGRFLHVSGVRFSYHAQNGAFLVDASDVEVGGKPLDLNATYSVTALDYMYLHGTDDGFTLFADATRPPKILTEREADFRTTVEKAIRAQGTVTADVDGRIARR